MKIPRCVIQSSEKSIMIRKNAKNEVKFNKAGDSIELHLPI
jgi:hypothetical protein